MNRDFSAALKNLQKRLPTGALRLEPEFCKGYAGDKWFAAAIPEAVALPGDAATVSQILKFASKNKIPVTPRGAGYGYVGGCVPVRGGIVLSLERLNRRTLLDRKGCIDSLETLESVTQRHSERIRPGTLSHIAIYERGILSMQPLLQK